MAINYVLYYTIGIVGISLLALGTFIFMSAYINKIPECRFRNVRNAILAMTITNACMIGVSLGFAFGSTNSCFPVFIYKNLNGMILLPLLVFILSSITFGFLMSAIVTLGRVKEDEPEYKECRSVDLRKAMIGYASVYVILILVSLGALSTQPGKEEKEVVKNVFLRSGVQAGGGFRGGAPVQFGQRLV